MDLFKWRKAIFSSDLKSITKHVLLTLSCHMDMSGKNCFPTIKTLSTETSLSERCVGIHLELAEKKHWIKRQKVMSGRKWANYKYESNLPIGTDPCSVPIKESYPHGTEPGSAPFQIGTDSGAIGHDPHDIMVPNQDHTNSSFISKRNSCLGTETGSDEPVDNSEKQVNGFYINSQIRRSKPHEESMIKIKKMLMGGHN